MLDVSGPFAFFSAAGMSPILVGVTKRKYISGQGVEYVAQAAFKDLKKLVKGDYITWVPGGFADDYNAQFYRGNPLFTALYKLSKKAVLNCAVCTGAHIAAASGMLKGCKVTTHWAFKKPLSQFDLEIVPKYPRYYYDRKNRVMTGGGVSSGLDEVLKVISKVAGLNAAMSAQLINEYAPNPPFNAGLPTTAPKKIVKQTIQKLKPIVQELDDNIREYLNG
jgi:cyclohexyl-isocyanide hydratase